ncbi:MAG TPA: 2-phosphosulfolactate phosphatase [Steroidobacteraceae bacterium]|nr:2-phosphosulfolactate phosphatase [Steroidobacteraceae bacterium]
MPSGWRPAELQAVDFVAGARSARGIAVVIDVFRAFSLAPHAFARGARAIVPVAEVEEARELKRLHPDWLLIGERHARPLPGFDSGNSPADLERFDLRDRTLIHTTHSGTQGLAAATGADEVITGSFVNAGAIVRYIRERMPAVVTLVRMGKQAQERCAEDDLCAQLLQQRLSGEAPSVADVPQRLRSADSAAMFFDPACDWAPLRDFELCTQVDAFDFVLKLERGATPARLRRIEVPQ